MGKNLLPTRVVIMGDTVVSGSEVPTSTGNDTTFINITINEPTDISHLFEVRFMKCFSPINV